MPFTTQDDRKKMDDYLKTGIKPAHITPGDWCYLFYAAMVKRWKADRRWTTAHKIFGDILDDIERKPEAQSREQHIALVLAWQVFFQLHVMPYELEKRGQNGDI